MPGLALSASLLARALTQRPSPQVQPQATRTPGPACDPFLDCTGHGSCGPDSATQVSCVCDVGYAGYGCEGCEATHTRVDATDGSDAFNCTLALKAVQTSRMHAALVVNAVQSGKCRFPSS